MIIVKENELKPYLTTLPDQGPPFWGDPDRGECIINDSTYVGAFQRETQIGI